MGLPDSPTAMRPKEPSDPVASAMPQMRFRRCSLCPKVARESLQGKLGVYLRTSRMQDWTKELLMSKTNFDLFLEEQFRDLDFAEPFKRGRRSLGRRVADCGAPGKG